MKYIFFKEGGPGGEEDGKESMQQECQVNTIWILLRSKNISASYFNYLLII